MSKTIERLEKRLAEERAKENAKAIMQKNALNEIKGMFFRLFDLYLVADKDNKVIIRKLCKSIARDIPDIAFTIGAELYNSMFTDFNASAKEIAKIRAKLIAESENNDESKGE